MKLSILTTDGADSGDKAELNDAVFAIEPNETVLYEDVRRYMANQRQGTAKTKERSEVRGGGRKAYRQKGTGMARRGSIRSPLLKGGGTVFGPRPRSYSFKMNRKSRQLARKSALSVKAGDDAIKIIDDISLEQPKTSRVADLLSALELNGKKVLMLTAETDIALYKSARNIPGVEVMEANKPTTYQILNADCILIQKNAIEVLEGSFENEEAAA